METTAWVYCMMFEDFKNVCYMHCTGQRVTKLPVLFQPYLLQIMYMTFQYLTVSCIPAIGFYVWYLTFIAGS